MGYPDVRALQGDMSQEARYKVMDAFKTGKLQILIATDVASRGLDVPNIDLVVNYTLLNNGRIEGVQEEKQHAGDLVRVLREASQHVPDALAKIAESSQGNKATKKKDHP